MPIESSPEHPQPLRVIASAVRGWVDKLGPVWVEAQLIELNRRETGRFSFLTLRDPLAEVSVSVTVSASVLAEAGPIERGATVVARLKPTYYETSGRLSFACDALTVVGVGRLLARIEQTRRLLQAEGLFDPARKRPLPFLPTSVGLVTGAGSAAERDVVENARRRWPAVRIVARHVIVQGQQAAGQVMDAVRALDRDAGVDVIVIARGGGSVEELLPFSDEGLVRAVAACRTPVVSAIGHESDHPLLDFVADLRASTPTDAAKRIVPDAAEESLRVGQATTRLRQAIHRRVQREQERLANLRTRPVLADPTASFVPRYEQLSALRHRARQAVSGRLAREQTAIEHTRARIRTLSPQATLERGYALVLDASGHTVRSVRATAPGAALTTHLADGRLRTVVIGTEPTTEGER